MFKCCYSNYEENSHSLAFTKASVFCCESMELNLWVYFEYYYTQTFTTRRNSTVPDSLITGLHWENETFPHSQLDKSSLSQGFQKIACEKTFIFRFNQSDLQISKAQAICHTGDNVVAFVATCSAAQ